MLEQVKWHSRSARLSQKWGQIAPFTLYIYSHIYVYLYIYIYTYSGRWSVSDRELWQNWCLVISGAEKKTCSADEFSFSAALGSKFERTSRKGFDNTHGAKRSHGFFEKFQPRLGFVWPGAEVWLSVTRFLSRCHEALSVSFCCYCFKQQLTTTNTFNFLLWLWRVWNFQLIWQGSRNQAWQGSRNVWYNAYDVSVSPSIYLSAMSIHLALHSSL